MIATEKPQLPIGTVLADTYRITRHIAVGGMGELYEATHLRLAGRYALKVLLPQFAAYDEVIARFQREAEITSSLRHPNIVSVLDFNTSADGRAFLAMEFLEGNDLAAELAQHGPMGLPRVLDIAGQIVSALSAAHAHGVVHRDLKPSNLFLSSLPGDGREIVKVLDFGISKMREVQTKLTREHSIMGTPQYMAPEQALGKGAIIDHRTDQFSLAAIIYELLAGREAFWGDSVPAVLYQVVHESPRPLSQFRADVPRALEQVLLRALAKTPAARYPSIGEFGQALLAGGNPPYAGRPPTLATAPTLVQGATMGSRPRPATLQERRRNTTFGASSIELRRPEYPPTLRRRRGGWPSDATVGILVVAAIGAGAWLFLRNDGGPQQQAAAPAPVRPPLTTPSAPPSAPAPEPERAPPLPPPAEAPPLPPAPVEILNAPSELRVTVDGAPMDLPLRLPRKVGRYLLRFESPGRQGQILEVDGMADRHELRLSMPRLASERPRPVRRERDDEDQPRPPAATADPPPVEIFSPPPAEPAPPPKPRPSLIEDVDDEPAPSSPPEKPRVPLIDEP